MQTLLWYIKEIRGCDLLFYFSDLFKFKHVRPHHLGERPTSRHARYFGQKYCGLSVGTVQKIRKSWSFPGEDSGNWNYWYKWYGEKLFCRALGENSPRSICGGKKETGKQVIGNNHMKILKLLKITAKFNEAQLGVGGSQVKVGSNAKNDFFKY